MDKKEYYGFYKNQIVTLKSTIECDGIIIDKGTRFMIYDFPPKTTKANKLSQNSMFNMKEWSRNYFVYGKTFDCRHVRTYISNIERNRKQ